MNRANGQKHLLLHVWIRFGLDKLRQHGQGIRLAGQGLCSGESELRIGLTGRDLAEYRNRLWILALAQGRNNLALETE
ncbi:MAG: hypothetical protein ABSH21_11075 [Verrucomicrobiia bacterium]